MGQLATQRDALAAAAAGGETQKEIVASQQASLDALAAAVRDSGMTTGALAGKLGEAEARLGDTEAAVHALADAMDGSRGEHNAARGAQERLEETAEMLRARLEQLEAEASTGSTNGLRDMLQRLSLQLQGRRNAAESSADGVHGGNTSCHQPSAAARACHTAAGGEAH